MKKPSLIGALVLGLFGGTRAILIGSNTHVLHEKRYSHHAWRRQDRVNSQAIIPLRIGLVQQNLDDETAYQKLMEVSHPDSPKYGQFLEPEEVHRMFAPSEFAAKEVKEWLTGTGLQETDILEYHNKAWLASHISAEKFEQLFHAELFEYEHKATREMKIGCDQYHVPKHLQKHIDYITPGVAMSARVQRREVKTPEDDLDRRAVTHSQMATEEANTHDENPLLKARDLGKDVNDCGRNVTIACIRALYGLPKPTRNDSVNSLGIWENFYTFNDQDLDEFFTKYAPEIPNGTRPIVLSVDGGEGPFANRSDKHLGTEPALDIQISWPLIYPQTITVYQVEDAPQAELEIENKLPGYLNTWLDSVDGSYCNYSAFGITGDSPGLDAVYPDDRPGGFNKPQMCGTYNLTRVVSISYGQGEHDLPIPYQKRQCNEFMKLALQGHTIITSAGDAGVSSFANDTGRANGCLSGCGFNDTFYKPGENCPYTDLKGKVFHPTNPGNCPYVLSVGGTTLYDDQTILDAESGLYILQPNKPNNPLAGGGGFSNFFPQPAYQKKALETYFKDHAPKYPYYFANADATNIGSNGGIYNRGGRAYPDVAAIGAKIRGTKWHKDTKGVVSIDLKFSGTSASAPIWGAIITLINQERTAVGKGPVGFVQPVLYEHPEAFNDIVNGTNPGCGTVGFPAVKGWDPITGLGTPNYPKLLEIFLKLP